MNEWKISPGCHFLCSLLMLFLCLAYLLLMAPLGRCYRAPMSSWASACQFQGEMVVHQGKDIKLSDANCDALYDKGDWQEVPKIKFRDAVEGHLYTVMVVDPDAPRHPNGTYYLHMIQTNILGEDLKAGNIFGKSLTIAPYIGPAPPSGSGDHRYMFIAYEHCKIRGRLPAMKTPARYMFNLKEWLESLPLKLLGPVAGVQFKAHF